MSRLLNGRGRVDPVYPESYILRVAVNLYCDLWTIPNQDQLTR